MGGKPRNEHKKSTRNEIEAKIGDIPHKKKVSQIARISKETKTQRHSEFNYGKIVLFSTLFCQSKPIAHTIPWSANDAFRIFNGPAFGVRFAYCERRNVDLQKLNQYSEFSIEKFKHPSRAMERAHR